MSTSLSSKVVQPACDTELLFVANWREYIDELVSTGKIISFATKTDISQEDLRFLADINKILLANGKVLHIGVTVVRLNDWKEIEPRAPSPLARITTLRRLWESGIGTTLLARPMFPMVTHEEIDEIVERTYRFCHGYLSGPLYLTSEIEKYMNQKGCSFIVTERVAKWMQGQPRLRVVECKNLEKYLRNAAKKKGRKLFNSNVEAAIYVNDVCKREWTAELKWTSSVRREIVGTIYVVDPATKEFLLLFHRELGKWLPPGGHVEKGETPLQAALREAVEELEANLHLLEIQGELDQEGKDFRQIPIIPGSHSFCTIEEFIHPIGAQDPHIHVDCVFVGVMECLKRPKKHDTKEVMATDWFPISQIEKLSTFDNVAVICRAISKAMEK